MSILADHPLGGNRGVEVARANVEIDVRERGKLVRQHCRASHNIWVTLGREYLAKVIAPNWPALDDHYDEATGRRFIKYVGIGIGGKSQTHPAAFVATGAGTLGTDFPVATGSAPGGDGNRFEDTNLAIPTLERPVPTERVSAGPPETFRWLAEIAQPTWPAGTTLRVTRAYATAEVNTIGGTTYSVMPIAEAGLFLAYWTGAEADAVDEKANVYDATVPGTISPPWAAEAATTRHKLMAYNTFEPIPKTVSFELELRWELRFA